MSQDDFALAAEKHLMDATCLIEAKRHDGAAYLSGYVVECVLKAILSLEKEKTPKKSHDLPLLIKDLQALASIQPEAKHYVDKLSLLSFPYKEPPLGWKETLRYHRPGLIDVVIAETWVDTARKYYEIIEGLRLDGEVNVFNAQSGNSPS